MRKKIMIMLLILLLGIGAVIFLTGEDENFISGSYISNQEKIIDKLVLEEDVDSEYISKIIEGSLVNVMIKNIEFTESEDEFRIIFTSFDNEISSFMENFEISYNEDYYELSFYNLWEGLPADAILVNPSLIEDVTDSEFVDNWYKTILFGDSVIGYGIRFNNDINYSIEKLIDPGRITISIVKSLNPREQIYTLRSPSNDRFNTRRHFEDTLSIYHTYLDETPKLRVLKDHNGYFNCIFSSTNKTEVENLRDELLRYYEEYIIDRNIQENTYYNLVIENH